MGKTIQRAATVLALAFLAGCAVHETYGDRNLADAERAVIEGYSRYALLYFEDLQIVSVDGRREGGQSGWPYASSVSLPSGKHWLQVLILRNNRDIAMCAFEATFEAGHRYQLERVYHQQALLAHPSSSRFSASISMEVTGRSTPRRPLDARAECGTAAHCRVASDCRAQYACQTDAGFEFGVCRPNAR